MKRPMLIVALFYATGILLGDCLPASWPVGWFLGQLVITAFIALLWADGRRVLLPVALISAGMAGQMLHRSILSPYDLRRIATDEPAIVTVRGRLVETPYQRVYTHRDEVTVRTQAALDLEAVRWRNGSWQPAFGRVMAGTPETVGAPFFGGRAVEVEGVLRLPRGAAAEGAFDYASYLRRHGIHFQLQVASTNDWRLSAPTDAALPPPVADRFARWARQALARGLPAEDESLRLLWAMTLGWRTALTGEVSEPFMQSGTMHVFAISGLHVALICAILVGFLRVCRLPRAWCGLVIIPLLWLYSGVTGWQASAVRSTVMMSVIIAGWSLRRPSDLLNSLAAAAVIILVWDPQQLFQASFQLSFSVVLSLALFIPVLDNLRRRVFQFDPWIPDEMRPDWQRRLHRPLDRLGTSVVVSLASWIGSIPLVALYFHLFTPVSLVANLVIVPLSGGALACSLASLSLGAWIPFFGELFNHSAWFFMTLMVRVSQGAAAVPGACLYLPAPSPLFLLAYYASLIAVFSGALKSRRFRPWSVAILVVLVGLYGLDGLRRRLETRLTVLPLQGSAAIYVDAVRPRAEWLIDCGNEAAADLMLKPFLRAQGVNRLDNLLLTHGDIQHVGGAVTMAGLFRPRTVWFGPVEFRSTAYREAKGLFQSPPVARILQPGEFHPPWTVLHPDARDRFSQADDAAVVLLGELEQVRILLLSDLGKPGQNALLSRWPEIRADILVTGLPHQSEPVAETLIEITRPALIIVADAEYPATQRANRRLRERLAGHPLPVLYTRQTGALTLRLNRGRWRVDGMDGTLLEGGREQR